MRALRSGAISKNKDQAPAGRPSTRAGSLKQGFAGSKGCCSVIYRSEYRQTLSSGREPILAMTSLDRALIMLAAEVVAVIVLALVVPL